jgi:hypothetical protein
MGSDSFDDDALAPPRGLLLVALVAGAGVAAFGSVGLLLAVTRTYHAALALPLGAIATAALVALAAPKLPGPVSTGETARRFALIGIAAILAITIWNGLNASQHVLQNRDGGVYAEAGRWIARAGSLDSPAGVGPFRSSPIPVFGFSHLLPALLAQAYAIGGGDGLYHLPPLLGGVALLEFFVLAWRVLRRPGFAVAATLALGLIIPQVAFTRDTYSEIPTQILLFSALWLLIDRDSDRGRLPHWRIMLTAGLLLGATQATHIDAMTAFIGLPVFLAFVWLYETDTQRRRRLVAPIGAFLLGLVPGVVLGLVDLVNHSGTYWDGLWHNEREVILACIASAVVCAAAAVARRFVVPIARALARDRVAWATAVLVAVAGFSLWFVRPFVQGDHGYTFSVFENHGHLSYRYVHLDYQRSMIWMAWYLGPVTIAAALIGAALLMRELVHRRSLRAVAPLAVLLPGSLLYLWNASAQPDHVWVTRRFLVNAFPLLILLALGLAAQLWTKTLSRRWLRPARFVAIAVAVVAVAFPVYAIIPVAAMREQAGYLTVINDACQVLGDNAAVAVVGQLPVIPADVREDQMAQALRSWCGSSVIVDAYNSVTGAALRRTAAEWKARGRQFFVVALNAATIRALVPNATISATHRARNTRFLTETLTERPHTYQTQSFSFVIGSIPPR